MKLNIIHIDLKKNEANVSGQPVTVEYLQDVLIPMALAPYQSRPKYGAIKVLLPLLEQHPDLDLLRYGHFTTGLREYLAEQKAEKDMRQHDANMHAARFASYQKPTSKDFEKRAEREAQQARTREHFSNLRAQARSNRAQFTSPDGSNYSMLNEKF
ncbi:hypothetical protein JKX24_01315 [Serratia proteamaculans]|uniref:Uncharacterized protein n=1 Tax=Serratia proteamaculans TaxID=28151 RepID=A0A7U0N709_SERPR|nr:MULTISPECIES: hypothetical protein [Serratia]MBO1502642.1 hypothetical protein [Serratia proteamaculans]QQX53700.1 hypothetical protein JKX24_01315 [Serratia proteamaculans]CAI1596761.1 Uncharacterised protein [Serratia marcescens]